MEFGGVSKKTLAVIPPMPVIININDGAFVISFFLIFYVLLLETAKIIEIKTFFSKSNAN